MADDNKLVAEIRTSSARARPARSAPPARSPPSSTATAPSPQHVTPAGPRGLPAHPQGERGPRARHRRAPASSRWSRTSSATRCARSSSTSTSSSSARARRSPSTSPCTSRASPLPARIAALDANTLLARGRGHATSRRASSSRSRASRTGTQILAKDVELPEGSTLLSDPEALVVNVDRRGRAGPGRGRRDRRAGDVVAETAESAAARGHRTSAAASERASDGAPLDETAAWATPGSSSGSAIPGPSYAGNRHNVGPDGARRARRPRLGGSFKRHKARTRRSPRAALVPGGPKLVLGEAEQLHEPLGRPGRRAAALLLARARRG